MSEFQVNPSNFEQKSLREIEQKFLPLFPETLDEFRSLAVPIEQIYLSHPSEDFNLRIRETLKPDGARHKATLKDSGQVTPAGLDRLEIETPVAQSTYDFHHDLDLPTVKKLRAEPAQDIVIDFFDDGHIHAESENPESWRHFLHRHSLDDTFVDVTGDRLTDNEWRAHWNYRRAHSGKEALVPASPLDIETVREEILRHQVDHPVTVARISGRSGSGKSTFIHELQTRLREVNASSIVLSTDDYHRGKTWLERENGGQPWTAWDAPIVYDRALLKNDIESLRRGEKIVGRTFDFACEEPKFDGTISPAPIILLEGIYARHNDFSDSCDLSYELPTPLATCIGRRILRDLVERPQFAAAECSLSYALEQAEPAWRSHDA